MTQERPARGAVGEVHLGRVVEQQRPERRATDRDDERHDDDGHGQHAEEEEHFDHLPLIGRTPPGLKAAWTIRIAGAGKSGGVPRRHAIVLLAAAALGLSGCGTSDDDRRAVRAVVDRFYTAVREDDGRTACDQLSEPTLQQLESQTEQSCDEVVTRLTYDGGAIVDAHVYLTNAEVGLRSGEHAFLSHGRSGWKLSAIGCKPQGPPRERPMDCEAEA